MSENKRPVFLKADGVKDLYVSGNKGFGEIDMFEISDSEGVIIQDNELHDLMDDKRLNELEKIINEKFREVFTELKNKRDKKDLMDYLQTLGAVGQTIIAILKLHSGGN